VGGADGSVGGAEGSVGGVDGSVGGADGSVGGADGSVGGAEGSAGSGADGSEGASGEPPDGNKASSLSPRWKDGSRTNIPLRLRLKKCWDTDWPVEVCGARTSTLLSGEAVTEREREERRTRGREKRWTMVNLWANVSAEPLDLKLVWNVKQIVIVGIEVTGDDDDDDDHIDVDE
jgi:hypothetical protein